MVLQMYYRAADKPCLGQIHSNPFNAAFLPNASRCQSFHVLQTAIFHSELLQYSSILYSLVFLCSNALSS